MTQRMRYPEVAPEGYAALAAFGHYVNTATALEPVLLGMVYLRASVLNGCDFCTELHQAELRKHHEPESRITAVLEKPDSEAFTPRECAALRWTAVITNLQQGHAADEEYAAISEFFQGKDLVDLTFAIANINAWNRMGVAFRPEWRPHAAGASGDGKSLGGQGEGQAGGRASTAAAAGGPGASGNGAEGEDDDGGKVASD